MSILETFPDIEFHFYQNAHHPENRDKDNSAMHRMRDLLNCIGDAERSGVTYAIGSWGYTVLRTAYSGESDTLWPIAMDKLNRWVTKYFVHINRLISNKPDGTVNEEVARRFILEVVEARKLEKPLDDLSEASQDDIRLLVKHFEAWAQRAAGTTDFDTRENPRFCDFLVIDEGSLRSLVALPDETPPLDLVSRTERRARIDLYENAYVWLVDSRAVNRFQGVEDGDNYDGWMKLEAENIDAAWFEKASRRGSDYWTFDRVERQQEPGIKWYQGR